MSWAVVNPYDAQMPTDDILRESAGALDAIKREPFLAALADNSLPAEALGRWVLDDTHFLRALRRMMARLIADAPDEGPVDVITGAYPALQFELDRFAQEARRLGMELERPPGPVTQRFNALLEDVSRKTFAEGIVVYWAVEYAYLAAWDSVRDRVGLREPYAEWIENWTSDGFREFVTALGGLADDHGASDTAAGRLVREVFELERDLWRWCYDGNAGS